MSTPEVNELKRSGYNPQNYYNNNAELNNLINFINKGIGGKTFGEIGGSITHHDPYMVLADFADYRNIQKQAEEIWADKDRWTKMSLMNTAKSGVFASDNSINKYASEIWHMTPINKIK